VTREAPKVWLLLGKRVGDNAQARALARLLDVEAKEIDVRFNWLYRLPNALKGASLASLDKRRSGALEPPWPDLVIGTGRRSVPVARWIRRQSDHPVRLVQIGRPQAEPEQFDLVLTTPQYRLAPHYNVIELPLPLTLLNKIDLNRAATRWRSSVADLRRPLITVVVGGDTSTCRFGADEAKALAQLAGEYAGTRGGSLLVLTSARTSPQAVVALRAALPSRARLHEWRVTLDNPYRGYLALADEIIVTDDSASMIADAAATGKPLWLYQVPFRAGNPIIWGQDRLFSRYGDGGDGGDGDRAGSLVTRLVNTGWLSAQRRMDRLVAALVEQGKAQVFSRESLNAGLPPARPEGLHLGVAEAVARIRILMWQ